LYLIERAVDAATQISGRVTIASSSIDDSVEVTIFCSEMNPAACQADGCVVPFRPGERPQQRADFELSSVRAAMDVHGGKLTVFCKPQSKCGIKLEFPVHPPEHNVVATSEVLEKPPAYRQAGGL